MKLSKDKRIVEIVQGLVREGWALHRGKKHNQLRHPNGFTTLVPTGTGCPYARRNFEADLRRAARNDFRHMQHG